MYIDSVYIEGLIARPAAEDAKMAFFAIPTFE